MSKFIEVTLINTGQVTINLDHVLFATRWGAEGVQFKFINGETLIATNDDPEGFLRAMRLGNMP